MKDLTDISVFNYESLFQINKDIEIKLDGSDSFRYVYIDNFYKNIDEVYAYAKTCNYTADVGLCGGAPVLRALTYNGIELTSFCRYIANQYFFKPTTSTIKYYSFFSIYDGNLKYYYEHLQPHFDTNSYIWLIYLDENNIGTEIYKTDDNLKLIAETAGRYVNNNIFNMYEKIYEVSGKKNRFILFDGEQLHRFGVKKDDSFDYRLTQCNYLEYEQI